MKIKDEKTKLNDLTRGQIEFILFKKGPNHLQNVLWDENDKHLDWLMKDPERYHQYLLFKNGDLNNKDEKWKFSLRKLYQNVFNLKAIVAMTPGGLIGINGDIPWYLPEDFKHFKETTKGSTIVMGRKTWDSLPKKPLPNRTNVILSSKPDNYRYIDGVESYDKFRPVYLNHSNSWIIGGANVYGQFEHILSELVITWVNPDVVKEHDIALEEKWKVDMSKWKMTKSKKYDKFEIRWYKR